MSNTSKFKSDILWNIFSYGGILVIGVLLNILINVYYDEEALGVFNQSYAIYIFLSQLAVGGVHLSIQYYIPKYSTNKKHITDLLITAVVAAILTSILVVLFAYMVIPIIGKYFLKSQNVEKSLYYTLWGLLFFSINKIVLSLHNGLRNMKIFAMFQLLRFVLFLISLGYLIYFKYPVYYLSSILPVGEFLLFIIMFFSILKYLYEVRYSSRLKRIFKVQFKHGNKVLLGNFLLDLNTKVDVLILGFFLDDSKVGIYSFASTIFEGFTQIAVLLRNNLNPIITKTFNSNNNTKLFQKIIKRNVREFSKIIFILGILSIVFFPVIPVLFQFNNIFEMSILYFILCVGFMIAGGYNILLMIFNQIGYPELQTKYIFLLFISNAILNFVLIPILGLYGSALGTSLSYIFQIFLIKYFFNKHLHINLQ